VADRRHVDFLLCGGGIASANCARWLREEGAEGSILLVGREPDPPYDRPPASKKYLAGTSTREDARFRPAAWWDEQRIELLTRTSVMRLDTAERAATLSTKEEVSYGQALVATGANVRLLRVEGAQLDGIHYLRALGNADTLRADLEGRERVVVVGGSYIATEVAATLTDMGKRCTMLMQESVVHERGFGRQAGAFFHRQLEEHGVEIHGDDGVARFEGDGERVTRVVSERGLELEAEVVVMGTGAVPDVMLARQAGLELGESGGVRCSARLEASAPGVFAAGDVCEYESPMHGGPIRVEHWDVAFNHGRTAALNMLGRGVEHDVVPYFFSDLSDWASLEYVGPARSWDREVVRGSIEDGRFSVWYLDGGRVAAALSVERPDDLDAARRLIAARTALGDAAERLGDLDADLTAL
jgi:3-phenylpropionate/trans-cinnamate dioxygenase ferredoxin reductase subunit